MPYEIVPGVTAASAASSHAGVPLTDRDEASCVAFITGRERGEKQDTDELDYAAIAKFPGTLVFYMGITTAPVWSQELIAHGKSAKTPVAIVRRCSLPDQESFVTTLGELPDVLKQHKLRPPAVVIVGEVARERRAETGLISDHFLGRRFLLRGRSIKRTISPTICAILGADVLVQPAIEISPPSDWGAVDAVIDRLGEFDWLVFSSSNGVHFFMQRLLAAATTLVDWAMPGSRRLGRRLLPRVAEFHLVADVRPDEYRAEALAESISSQISGKRTLLLRASRGREVLAEMLTAAARALNK